MSTEDGHMQTDDPTVSVVLPVFNRPHLVRRAIESVLAQTITDIELIVVDDCSTDNTLDVVAEYESDPRLIVHRNDTNLGPAGARNQGIEIARGRYVAFQDSDDRWFPEKLARQLEALKTAPDCRVCCAGALYYAPMQCYYIPDPLRLAPERRTAGDLSIDMLYANSLTPQALLVDRDVFASSGTFNPSLKINEDWELAIRIAQRERFTFVEEPLLVIYRTALSVSSDRIADVEMREFLLQHHAGLYENQPSARAYQQYVIGCLHMEIGTYGAALANFRKAYKTEPNLRRLLQLQRARALSLTVGNTALRSR